MSINNGNCKVWLKLISLVYTAICRRLIMKKFFFEHTLIIIMLSPVVFCRDKTENNVLLEKVTYHVYDESLFSYHFIEWKPVARNVYRHNMTFILTRPLNEGWVHFAMYYKYTTYNKFLINLWEDFCGFWRGSGGSPLSSLALENAMRIGVNFSFKLQCPLTGKIMMTHSGLNMSQAVFPLAPAGRYRLDVSYAEKKEPMHF